MLDLARSLLAELDVDVVLDRVLQAARELTGARYAALGVLDESAIELGRFITVGIDEQTRAAIGDLPRGRGVLGELIENPTPLRLEDVGRHPRSYGFPAGHPSMETFLGVPIVIAGRPFGNLYLTEKEGGAQFTAEDEQAAVVLAEFAAVAVLNAQLYGGAKRQRDELKRTVATLEAMSQVTRAVGGQTDLAVVLEMVAKRGRALVCARVLVIELLDGLDELVIAAGAGEWPASMEGDRVSLADTVAETALRTLQTQPLEDELNRARFDQHGLGRLGVSAESGLAVPLVFNGRPYGVLMVIDRLRDGPGFTTEDSRLLEAFASSAATAVATAKSVASERHQQRLAAAEAERGRWARELHDETLQRLAALQIALSSARRSGRPERPREGGRSRQRSAAERDRQPKGADSRAAPAHIGRAWRRHGTQSTGRARNQPRHGGRCERRPSIRAGRRHGRPSCPRTRDHHLPAHPRGTHQCRQAWEGETHRR